MVLFTLGYDAKVKAIVNAYSLQVSNLWTLNKERKIITFQQYVVGKKLVDLELFR